MQFLNLKKKRPKAAQNRQSKLMVMILFPRDAVQEKRNKHGRL